MTTLLDPKSIRRISYIVEFLLIFNITEFLLGLLIYVWNFDVADTTTNTYHIAPSFSWLNFSNALYNQDLPITSRLLILLGSSGFVIIGLIGLNLYFGFQRARWFGCFFGVVLGGSAFFAGRILLRHEYPLYSVISFFVIESFSFIILNIFVAQLNIFTNLRKLKIILKLIIIFGNVLIQVVFPLLLILDESGYGPKISLISGWIFSVGTYSLGRFISVHQVVFNMDDLTTTNDEDKKRLIIGQENYREDDDAHIGSATNSEDDN